MTVRITSTNSSLTAGYMLGAITSGMSAAQEAAAVAAGVAVYATAQLNDPNSGTPPVPRVIAQSGIPCIIAPNGTVATGGTVTLGTALPLIYPQAWVYLPAGAVVGGLAGWYYVIFSSTAVGVVYTAYQATMSVPLALAAALLVIAVGSNAAYTQSTGAAIPMGSASIRAGLLGAGGSVSYRGMFSYNNSAGAKVAGITFGGSAVFTSSNTTTLGVDVTKRVQNRATNSQVIRNVVDSGTGSATAPTLLAIDTTAEVVAAFTGQIATATDYLILENFAIEATPAN